ncbi:unnamed protein product [Phytomonas sp. EM1]|nr:unnamed protein product [Phytomonas sp. EM1]|eukprot:CCW61575.1 unnamed protein product [Phytomonas sp. isolate EM1]
MPVVDRQSNRIDLSHQDGAVDASVLEQLRHALHLNKFFLHLDLSYNVLDAECISMLCTIIKDKSYLKTFSLVSCGITDKMLTFQLVPAFCTRGVQIAMLDLNKNEGITDKGIDSICHLLRVVNILDLRLSGTLINPKSAKKLLKALESNTTLEHLELPFTVGFEVLNRAKLLLRRNLRQGKDPNHAELADGSKLLPKVEGTPSGSPDNTGLGDTLLSKFAEMRKVPSLRRGSLRRGLATFNQPRRVLRLGSSSGDSLTIGNGKAAGSQLSLIDPARGSTGREATNGGSPGVLACSGSGRRGPYWQQRLRDVRDTLDLSDPESIPLSNWADPAINRSLKYLCILEKTL